MNIIDDDTRDFVESATNGAEAAPNSHILSETVQNVFNDVSQNTYGSSGDGVRSAIQNNATAADTKTQAYPSFSSMLRSDSQQQNAERKRLDDLSGKLNKIKEEYNKQRLLNRYERLSGSASGARANAANLSSQQLYEQVQALQQQKNGRFMVKVMRRMLCFAARIVEKIASMADKNSKLINLKGWCDSFTQSVTEYDELLFEIYDQYLIGLDRNPIGMLVYGMASNAAMYSMKQKLMHNPVLAAVRKAMYNSGSASGDVRRNSEHIGSPEDANSVHINSNTIFQNNQVSTPRENIDTDIKNAAAAVVEDDEEDDDLSLDTRA